MTLRRLFTAGTVSGRGGFFHSPAREHIRGLCVAVGVVILAAALTTWGNLDRSEGMLRSIMAEKGKMLLLALEGGVRSGSRTYAGLRFQYFLEELGNREDVRFIAVVMPDGTIAAHTNPDRVGEILTGRQNELSGEEISALTATGAAGWMLTDMEGAPAFVVYSAFLEGDRTGAVWPPQPGQEVPYIFLGLSTAPLERGRMLDQRRALMYGGGVLLVGLLLSVCVFALLRVRASGRGQREAEALVDELALNLPDGLLFLNIHGRVVSMNQSAQRLLWSQDEATADGNPLPEALRELVDRLPHEATLEDTEICLERESGPLFLSVRGGHVGDAEDRIGSIVLLRDVSEVRRLEAEVRRREKLAAVGNLAAGVAHELRNPLSSIKGYATYFSERFPEGSDEREAARVMVRETDRLNRSISDLLGLARPMQIRVKNTDVRALLQDAVRLIRQDAEMRGVHLSLECAPDLPEPCLVPVDPDRVRQVLLNLSINALDAMPEGGTLRLRLFVDAQNPQLLVMEVADTGTGIAPEHMAHVFDPYFTTKGHGTGLGLATVHKIMEAHGGCLAVNSTPGQGTTFRLGFHGVLAKAGGTQA